MNAFERYLAVYDDSRRSQLDRVGTFVQYIKGGFIKTNKRLLRRPFEGKLKAPRFKLPFWFSYFKVPYSLGFDSIFAPISPSLWVKRIKVKDANGRIIHVGETGQAPTLRSGYYDRGYITEIEILEQLQANISFKNMKFVNKIFLKQYEKIAPYIYPVLQVGGIFDRVWRAMGMTPFSRHFAKKTRLYTELVKFYAGICKHNVEGVIDAIQSLGRPTCIRVLNLLDDVAFKGRSMISPARWKEDYLPYYKEINKLISDAGLISQVHTDGDVTELVPFFQAAGFRGLQGWEGGVDPSYINDHFPNFVVVGFADVGDILPFGTPQQVDQHVKSLMDALKGNRHFIIGPSTVIYERIPLQNVTTFIQAVHKYGQYV